jgi:hypothetical protein
MASTYEDATHNGRRNNNFPSFSPPPLPPDFNVGGRPRPQKKKKEKQGSNIEIGGEGGGSTRELILPPTVPCAVVVPSPKSETQHEHATTRSFPVLKAKPNTNMQQHEKTKTTTKVDKQKREPGLTLKHKREQPSTLKLKVERKH